MRFLLHPHGSRVNLTRDRYVHAIGKNGRFSEKNPSWGVWECCISGKAPPKGCFLSNSGSSRYPDKIDYVNQPLLNPFKSRFCGFLFPEGTEKQGDIPSK